MQSSFYLGIHQLWDELLILQKPGLYWLNSDQYEDALQLCRQTLNQQALDANVALVTVGREPTEVIDASALTHLKALAIFSLPASTQAIMALPEDMMRSFKPRNSFVILYSSVLLWQRLTFTELKKWLTEVNDWLSKENCCLLVISHGIGGDSLRSFLALEHRLLYGLANIIHHHDHLKYEIDFWCNNLGVSAGQKLTMLVDQQGLTIDESSYSQTQAGSDRNLCMVNSSVLEDNPPLSDDWQLFHSNESVAAAGLQTREATLIFALEKRQQVDTLVYQIYHLRQQRGNGIKIVVRAMTPNIRANDEQLLLIGGANIVVGYVQNMKQFLSQVDAIQGDIFARHIPNDINQLMKLVRPLPIRGYVNHLVFSQSVVSLIHNALLPEDSKGLLIILTPSKGLTAQQALLLCRIRRDGDFITMVNNKLVLFLSNCNVNELNATLRFIFKLPVEQAFSAQTVWSRDKDILTTAYQLQELKQKDVDNIAQINDVILGKNSFSVDTISQAQALVAHEPKQITLQL